MSTETETLERALRSDLDALGDRFTDERYCTELYRALAGRAWRRDEGPSGHVALSWQRAEQLVNDLRRAAGQSELTLAQTGGEGEVARSVEQELETLGWRSVPLNTARHDDQHVDAAPTAREPSGDRPEWEREAHADAEEARAERGQRP